MKKKIIPKNSLIKLSALLLVFSLIISACTKEETVKNDKEHTKSIKTDTVVRNEKLVKFLSISLGVGKDEIIYNKINDEFLIRDQKYSRESIEAIYADANVYQSKYGE
ncbi:hypothetical protein [Pedobacter sp. V48]|uniref:hypothetical protein n=1 Tax=Pedobacter sp. V48 TaxID=509635 RepID=UPI0003E52D6C|nr:hypothetical protein [Pedobacter sp. V48]ETZ19861.1 hypothetical protein N824_06540 [Pedobacter sp. V48]